MKLIHVLVTSLATAIALGPAPRAHAAPEPIVIPVEATDDAAALVRAVSTALPMRHRYYDDQDKVLHVVNDPPPIVFSYPSGDTRGLLERIASLILGHRAPDAPYRVDFSRASATALRRPDPAPNAAFAAGVRTFASDTPGVPVPPPPLAFPNASDRLFDDMPAGAAPNHLNYFIIAWNPFRVPWANAERALKHAARRGLLTEPSFDELLADDRLVPVSQRAELIHEVETQLSAGASLGWRPKTIVWRHDDVATFEALKRVRVTALACARRLGP